MDSQEEEEVMLLGAWYSPYAHRVQWALNLKGVQYQIVEEDVYNKSTLLLNLNPINKKIPVLLHHEKSIVDSLNIVEYIDETWSHCPLLMPQDPYEKAMARFWANSMEDKLHKAIRRAIFFEGEKRKKEVNQAKEGLLVLEGMLNGMKFFGGESIGFLDIALGWITLWLGVFEEVICVKVFESDKYPHLHKWMHSFIQIKEIKKTLPLRDKLIPFFQNYGQSSRT